MHPLYQGLPESLQISYFTSPNVKTPEEKSSQSDDRGMPAWTLNQTTFPDEKQSNELRDNNGTKKLSDNRAEWSEDVRKAIEKIEKFDSEREENGRLIGYYEEKRQL